MKINNYGVNPVNPYKNQQLKTESTKKAATSFTDHIEISSKALDLQGIKDFASERVDQVKSIKSQVEAGTYKVDSDRLARDLLRTFRL